MKLSVFFTNFVISATLVNAFLNPADLVSAAFPPDDDAGGPCGEHAGETVRLETKNHFVYICSGVQGNPMTYYGESKKSPNQNIFLNILSYNLDEKPGHAGDRFVAVNRDTRYTVTRRQLLVSRGRRTILSERVINYQRN